MPLAVVRDTLARRPVTARRTRRPSAVPLPGQVELVTAVKPNWSTTGYWVMGLGRPPSTTTSRIWLSWRHCAPGSAIETSPRHLAHPAQRERARAISAHQTHRVRGTVREAHRPAPEARRIAGSFARGRPPVRATRRAAAMPLTPSTGSKGEAPPRACAARGPSAATSPRGSTTVHAARQGTRTRRTRAAGGGRLLDRPRRRVGRRVEQGASQGGEVVVGSHAGFAGRRRGSGRTQSAVPDPTADLALGQAGTPAIPGTAALHPWRSMVADRGRSARHPLWTTRALWTSRRTPVPTVDLGFVSFQPGHFADISPRSAGRGAAWVVADTSK